MKKNGYIEWPDFENAHSVETEIGQIVRYGDSYYISLAKGTYNITKSWYAHHMVTPLVIILLR